MLGSSAAAEIEILVHESPGLFVYPSLPDEDDAADADADAETDDFGADSLSSRLFTQSTDGGSAGQNTAAATKTAAAATGAAVGDNSALRDCLAFVAFIASGTVESDEGNHSDPQIL